MRAARLTAADDKGQLKPTDLLYKAFMVQWVLVNVDAAPDAGVVCTNWDNAQAGLNPLQMFFPQIVCWWLTDNDTLTCLFSIAARLLNFVGPVCNIQSGENCFKPCYVGHLLLG